MTPFLIILKEQLHKIPSLPHIDPCEICCAKTFLFLRENGSQGCEFLKALTAFWRLEGTLLGWGSSGMRPTAVHLLRGGWRCRLAEEHKHEMC